MPKIGAPNLPSTKTSAEPQAPVKIKTGSSAGRIKNLGAFAHPKRKARKK